MHGADAAVEAKIHFPDSVLTTGNVSLRLESSFLIHPAAPVPSMTPPQASPGAASPAPTNAAIGATRLLDLQTCTSALPPGAAVSPGSNQLPPGTFGCRAQGLIRAGDVRLLTFALPDPSATEAYTLMIMMRSVNGFPAM
jgi:hypothetical protein